MSFFDEKYCLTVAVLYVKSKGLFFHSKKSLSRKKDEFVAECDDC